MTRSPSRGSPEEARRLITETRLQGIAETWGGVRCSLCDRDVDLDPDDALASWEEHVVDLHDDRERKPEGSW